MKVAYRPLALAFIALNLVGTVAHAAFDMNFGKSHPCASNSEAVGHADGSAEVSVFAIADQDLLTGGDGTMGSSLGSTAANPFNAYTTVANPDTVLPGYSSLYRSKTPQYFNFPNTCSLSDAELLALADYTGSGYKSINAQLRKEPINPAYSGFNEVIDKALLHLNLVTGRVYKGSSMKLTDLQHRWFADHPLNTITSYNVIPHVNLGYLFSTSLNKSTAEGFAGASDDNVSVLFEINTLTGRFIDPMSQFQSEEEVLLRADTDVIVSNAYQDGNGMYHVHLDEWVGSGPMYCGRIYPPSESQAQFGIATGLAMKDYPNGQLRMLRIPLSLKKTVPAIANLKTEACGCLWGAIRGHDDINGVTAAEFDTLDRFMAKPLSACKN